jgi:hypothetical protein
MSERSSIFVDLPPEAFPFRIRAWDRRRPWTAPPDYEAVIEGPALLALLDPGLLLQPVRLRVDYADNHIVHFPPEAWVGSPVEEPQEAT